MRHKKIMGYSYKYIRIDSGQKKIYLDDTEAYYIGELLLSFLDVDFSAYELNRQEILNTIKNSSEFKKKIVENKNKYQAMREQSYKYTKKHGREVVLSARAGIIPDFSDEQLFVIDWLSQEIDNYSELHSYFSLLDLPVLGITNYRELLDINFNFIKIQDLFREAIEFCLYRGYKRELESLDTIQRFYIFNKLNKSPFEHLIISAKILYEPMLKDVIEDTGFQRGVSLSGLISYVKEHDLMLTENYLGYDIASLLYTEFIQMVKLNIKVDICKNCGRYFVLKGLYRTKYCDRPIDGDKKHTCGTTVATNKQKARVSQDPSYKIYIVVMKRIYARKRLNKIDDKAFEELKNKIIRLKEDVTEGKITFADYKAEMDKI